MRLFAICCLSAVPALICSQAWADADNNNNAFISPFTVTSTLTPTVPHNGDVNPYGVAVVPVTSGALHQNNVLISNFNNSANFQGTGKTIVQITPTGQLTVFATIETPRLPAPCLGGIGLTTALVALRSGFVVVGSLPTTDGTSATAKAGCLIILNSNGQAVAVLSGNGINGPWDMTALDLTDHAVLFVSNVLNGTVAANGAVVSKGNVLRIVLQTPVGGMPRELSRTVIADAFQQRTDPAALVIGPTGLGLSSTGDLYVADTLLNRIAVIHNALTRTQPGFAGDTVSQGGFLNGPLGLAIAPNGDILTVNAGDGNMVETTPQGKQVAWKPVDVSGQGGGTLFGLALTPRGDGVYYVDDGNNTLNLFH
jgi:hypothetical protein